MATEESSSRQAIIPNLVWERMLVEEDSVSYKCVKCKTKNQLHIGSFEESQPEKDKKLTPTDFVIHKGRTVYGNTLAFIIALVISAIISSVIGIKTTTPFAIIAAGIFLSIRKKLVLMFMQRLTVLIHECIICRNKTYFTKDGRDVSIGKVPL